MNETTVTYKDKQFQFILDNVNDHIQSILIRTKEFYEIDLLRYLDINRPSDGIAIDIGSNIGNHSIFFSGVLGMDVISIEPLESMCHLLKETSKANDLSEKIKINNCAIGSCDKFVSINVIDKFNIGKSKISQNPGNIKQYKLDNLLSNQGGKVSLIKIDVEGMEIEVLKGAEMIIKNNFPDLILELNSFDKFDEAYDILEEYGYHVIVRKCFTPTFIFKKTDKASLISRFLEQEIVRLGFKTYSKDQNIEPFQGTNSERDHIMKSLIRLSESVEKMQTAIIELNTKVDESFQHIIGKRNEDYEVKTGDNSQNLAKESMTVVNTQVQGDFQLIDTFLENIEEQQQQMLQMINMEH